MTQINIYKINCFTKYLLTLCIIKYTLIIKHLLLSDIHTNLMYSNVLTLGTLITIKHYMQISIMNI